jgi:intraflagellar transport protein 56
MQDVNPSLPAEYILKGIVYALIGQETNNVRIVRSFLVFKEGLCFFISLIPMQKEYLDTAIQYLHLVGGSSSECDTIPGNLFS